MVKITELFPELAERTEDERIAWDVFMEAESQYWAKYYKEGREAEGSAGLARPASTIWPLSVASPPRRV